MTPPFRTIFKDALAHLKSADVLAATHLIQRSLGIASGATRRNSASDDVADTSERLARSLRPTASTRQRTAEQAEPLPAGRPSTPPPLFRNGTDTAGVPSGAKHRSPGFSGHTYHSATGSLEYKLYVPANLSSRRDLALVLMLHGCTQDPDDFAHGTGMNGIADEFGLIVAYPHQPRTANQQGCWNWFEAQHQRRDAGEPAVLAGLAQAIAREFAIPAGRVFAAGLSAGGAMADVLATAYPDVFAAVGIHSGVPCGAATNMMSAFAAMQGKRPPAPRISAAPRSLVRKIIFHGDADHTVNASNGQLILDGVRSDLARPAPEVTTETKINGRRVTRTSLDGHDGGTLAEHWVVHGSGHAWAGGTQGGSFVDTSGPDASREMVQFFLRR